MTLETEALLLVGFYIAGGILWSTRLRCWWRAYHDEIKMNVPVEVWVMEGMRDVKHIDRQMVWHCKWCGHRRPVR